MRATLESIADAILVADDKGKLIHFNEDFIGIWKIPREVLESSTLDLLRDLMSQNFDGLELKDGQIYRSSKVLALEGDRTGRVWTFRDSSPSRDVLSDPGSTIPARVARCNYTVRPVTSLIITTITATTKTM